MAAVLATSDRVEVVAMCDDGDSLWAAIERENPDVAIVDIRMPPSGDQEGINIASRLRRERPEIGLIALSQWAEPAMAMAFLRPSSGKPRLPAQGAAARRPASWSTRSKWSRVAAR